MDINTACRILGIESKASLEEIEAAKRNLLQALHPDKHLSDQKEIFEKMTRDVIEASQRLGNAVGLRGEKPRKDSKAILEKILFDERFYSEKTDGTVSKSKKLVKYDKRYDSDSVLAVAVLSIDYAYSWHTTSLFGGSSQNQVGCAISLVFLNRTKNLIADFDIGMNSSLVDEQGYQYSPCDNCFYSISGSGSFNKHANFLAPHSKIDGTILFPQLRKDSTKFVRWFLRGRFWIDKVLQEKNYDISLV